MKSFIETRSGTLIPCTISRAPFVPNKAGVVPLHGGKSNLIATVKGDAYRRVNSDMTVNYGGTLCKVV